jgi:pyruvate/2-oxoglutarate dehydrogenase complex dihydrolipoamide dehydrogenase (E3) component
VVVATGGEAVRPRSIAGVSGANVFTATDLLSGGVKLREKKVAVIGSGMTGLETAELLVAGGNKVTIVEMAAAIAPGTWFQHRDDALPKLKGAGAEFLVGQKLVSIDAAGIVVEGVKDKEKRSLPFDAVVLSLGVRPENALYKELQGEYPRLYAIGDAVAPGRIANATESAYRAAVELH